MPFCADIYYRTYNGEPEGFVFPVILLHGAGGSLMGWPPSLRRLPGQRVFALDLPGHGHTLLPVSQSMGSLVRRLHQFITGMGFYHVVLVGYSLGGAVALSYASAYPDQIAAMVAISCGDRFEMPQELMCVVRKPANSRKAMEIFSKAAFHPVFPQAERRAILAPMAKSNPSVLFADLSIVADFCFEGQPPMPKFPSLFIGGSQDKITPPASVRRLSQPFNKPLVSIIEKTAHMVIYEKEEELRRKISEFLARVNKPV